MAKQRKKKSPKPTASLRKAILFTANSPQIAQAYLMIMSYRHPDRGAFDGDIWVLSTDLDATARAYLDQTGVRYFVDEMTWAEDEMDWRNCVPPAPEQEALHAFRIYRNKRMSKLIYTDWFKAHGADYDAVAVCDNDLYAQSPINDMFRYAENGCINYWREDYPMWPGTSLWRKDFRYRQVTGNWDYDPGLHEVNIGFIIARPAVMNDLFSSLRRAFPDLPPRLIRDDRWHDQDLTRVLRFERPDLFALFPPDTILHLCGGGMELVEERDPGHFFNRVTGAKPAIIHFGGGAWTDFGSVKKPYLVDPQNFYENALHQPEPGPALSIDSVEYWTRPGVLVVRGTFRASHEGVRVIISTDQQGILAETRAMATAEDEDEHSVFRASWDCAIRIDALAPDDCCTATVLDGAHRVTASRAVDLRDATG